jgi:hypothetical protein
VRIRLARDAQPGNPRRPLYAAALAVLALGFAAALAIYAFGEDAPPASSTYVIVDGEAHAVSPRSTKRYTSQLERFGGKQAVLFDEFLDWVGSLWRGRRLAYTVAVLSAILAFGIWVFAAYLTPRTRR